MPEDQASPNEDEERIRAKAYELWQSEGEPHGLAEAHWTMAREMVATEDSLRSTLLPIGGAGDESEPAIAITNQGEFPGLADQGEETPHVPERVPAPEPVSAAPPAREKAGRAARR
ncbi:DUF2934 domain-containing protein [Pseudoxanthobacter sp. M-2]|uniref:DUF2934 domain-containing protein n=1 Tax=Pseudoxanthobacter sp. M-2 TaxID=3078754 RepID=UPI0038FD277F